MGLAYQSPSVQPAPSRSADAPSWSAPADAAYGEAESADRAWTASAAPGVATDGAETGGALNPALAARVDAAQVAFRAVGQRFGGSLAALPASYRARVGWLTDDGQVTAEMLAEDAAALAGMDPAEGGALAAQVLESCRGLEDITILLASYAELADDVYQLRLVAAMPAAVWLATAPERLYAVYQPYRRALGDYDVALADLRSGLADCGGAIAQSVLQPVATFVLSAAQGGAMGVFPPAVVGLELLKAWVDNRIDDALGSSIDDGAARAIGTTDNVSDAAAFLTSIGTASRMIAEEGRFVRGLGGVGAAIDFADACREFQDAGARTLDAWNRLSALAPRILELEAEATAIAIEVQDGLQAVIASRITALGHALADSTRLVAEAESTCAR